MPISRFLPCSLLALALAAPAAAGLGDDTPPTPAPPAPAGRRADFDRWVIDAAYAADGKLLLTAGGESLLYRAGDVVAWSPADGSRLADLKGHPTAVWAVAISPDGSLAATAGYDGLIKVWDLASREATHDLTKHKGWVRSLAFSPDGSRLATAGEDGSVVLWDPGSGAEIRTIAAHEGAATCVAFSPDGSTLASGGSDKLVAVWDPASGEQRARLEGHGDAVWAVAYSPDGKTLASCGADRTVRLWNTADNAATATLTGHKDWATSLAFSSDGQRLASGCLDGSVRLWDVPLGRGQEGPEPLASSVWCVAFTPDGSSLFAGTHAGPKMLSVPAPKLLPPPPPPPPEPTVAVLLPAEFASVAGATAEIGTEGVVTVSGPLAKDTYTLSATVPSGPRVEAFQLEVLPDPSLPSEGPGRAGNGNFVLSTFAVAHGQPGEAETATAVPFASAEATFEQHNYLVSGAIDDNAETGWGIHQGNGKAHTAIFRLPAEVMLPAGAPLLVTLDQQYSDGTHAIGKFRLSVVQAPAEPPAPDSPESPDQPAADLKAAE